MIMSLQKKAEEAEKAEVAEKAERGEKEMSFQAYF